MSANVYVIAGPNGAGNTTFAWKFLPEYADCRTFINADLIAKGVSPFDPDPASFRAGRLMLEEIELHASQGQNFGIETTLAGLTYLRLLRELTSRGFKINLFFLWLPSVDPALSRIRERVSRGGHDVPGNVVRRRFERSIQNFLVRYRAVASSWFLFDNSGTVPSPIAVQKGSSLRIIRDELYQMLLLRHGAK